MSFPSVRTIHQRVVDDNVIMVHMNRLPVFDLIVNVSFMSVSTRRIPEALMLCVINEDRPNTETVFVAIEPVASIHAIRPRCCATLVTGLNAEAPHGRILFTRIYDAQV